LGIIHKKVDYGRVELSKVVLLWVVVVIVVVVVVRGWRISGNEAV